MVKPEDALLARLNQLSPAQREALLKKIREQKSEKPEQSTHLQQLPITAIPRTEKDYPLSFAQQRLWFLEQLHPGGSAYNIAAALHLEGTIDSNLLTQTFNKIIQRHESLRTVFINTQEGARQKILDTLEWDLECVDLSSHQSSHLDTLAKHIHNESNIGFNLATGPLFRAKLFRLSDSEHALTIVMHHIISDAWSSQLLLNEISKVYTALHQKTAIALANPKIQYLDYAVWQRDFLAKGVAQKQLAYWNNKLAGYANLNLATDKPRPAIFSQKGAFHRITINKNQFQKLQHLCQTNGTTLFNGLLAAFQGLLFRYTQQTDFCIGTPVAGRAHQDTELLMGFFVNSLALKTDIQKDDSFKTLLKKVKKTTLDAQANQDIPFEQLVDNIPTDRDGSFTPIFQVFFSYTPGILDQQIHLPKLKTRFIAADTDTAKFDISLIIRDTIDGLSCHFEYNTDLFYASTIESMAAHFSTLLAQLTQFPEAPIHSLSMLSLEDLHDLVRGSTNSEFPNTDIASLFEQQAARTPDKRAVQQGKLSLTFAELNSKANQLAHHLLTMGVQQGDFIGLFFPPCIELSIGLLAAIKVGAVYVPMDPTHPSERINHIIANTGMEYLLSAKRIPTHNIHVSHCLTIDVMPLDNNPNVNPERKLKATDPLYVIYTSGSTGLPKAAMVNHRGECNLLHWYANQYHLDANDKFLVFSAIGFDLTQKNLLAPLCYGAELHFCDTEYYDPGALLAYINQYNITWTNCAPSAFYPLTEKGVDFSQLKSLTKLFFGGENIRLSNFSAWFQSPFFNAQITNMYGPTECTDIAASYTLADPKNHKGSIPIGSASANTSLYVLDEYMNILPKGAIGELYIGGAGVGNGYLNNAQLTAERFIANPFNATETLYKTGDFVRYQENDCLGFIARKDDQIKIRGFRMELGEIEANLCHLEGVDDAVVTARDINGQSQLIAFLCSSAPLFGNNFYKRALKQFLPDYMVPIAYFKIEHIPLTPNGKVDRKKLPVVDLSALKQSEYVAPRNATETQLVAIWKELLGIDDAGIRDNFFELGGHSLLATQLLTRIRDTFAIELPLRTLFEINTIEGLAEILAATNTLDINQQNDDDEAFEEGIL